MTDVAAFLLAVTVLSAALCGHQGQELPPVLRRRPAPSWARGRYRARRYARTRIPRRPW